MSAEGGAHPHTAEGGLKMSILGNRVLRKEDPKFLTVGATYCDDLRDERLDGAAFVTFVRSTVAHARITSIDTSDAKSAPGVIAVLTAVMLILAFATLRVHTDKMNFMLFRYASLYMLSAMIILSIQGLI